MVCMKMGVIPDYQVGGGESSGDLVDWYTLVCHTAVGVGQSECCASYFLTDSIFDGSIGSHSGGC